MHLTWTDVEELRAAAHYCRTTSHEIYLEDLATSIEADLRELGSDTNPRPLVVSSPALVMTETAGDVRRGLRNQLIVLVICLGLWTVALVLAL